ncbi:G patch domain-containing protein [Schistosoma japonicum]|uniref:G patch domain-containing protein n=1 Tax=Schistosoma japonicum TaxID=6182 RepID=A0A4Z2CQ12_SCHJA|nr:G patch domain-containing protein [Schistosoma japonicum]
MYAINTFIIIYSGFKPKGFHSTRKNRQRDLDEKFAQHPEDFMDDEDFGEFGIAPRRIRPTHEFDDTHVRDTLQIALGEQSVIPQAASLLKGLIVATRGTLAERLLRRLGWKNAHSVLLNDDTAGDLSQDRLGSDEPSVADADDGLGSEKDSSPTMFAQISFAAKTNTFGLGYSPLDPEVAMGRRKVVPNESEYQWSNRHPEESVSALLRRQQTIRSENEFDLKSGLKRRGITGHAFGVGALEEEDADVYEQDRLAEYDWEIGGGESNEEDEDEEQAEIEAARLGRLSSALAKKSKVNSTERTRIIDGWTAPSQNRESQKVSKLNSNVLPGFCGESAKQNELKTHQQTEVSLPPGYIPVFNPRCILTCGNKLSISSSKSCHPYAKHDALSRSRLLSDDSIYEKLDPIQQLRLKAAAAGLPVPSLVSTPTSDELKSCQSEDSNKLTMLTTSTNPTSGLLKVFKTDSNKQARFEAYQVLVRRGFTHEDAYHRCSVLLDLSNEEKEREASSFQAIVKTNQITNFNDSSSIEPFNVNNTGNDIMTSTSVLSSITTTSTNPSDGLPLSNKLPLHKQQLISSKLALRFRSAGCMDISKELTEAEEKVQRARVESLDTVEPRDHAVATESYGALTRRRLKWHPDKLLCKRINVPDPFPDSTFVGCPDERRPRNIFRQKFGKHGRSRFSDNSSNEFSIFDLLDVNTTSKQNQHSLSATEQQLSDESDSSNGDNDAGTTIPELYINSSNKTDAIGTTFQSRGKALFASLFQSIEGKTIENAENVANNNNNLSETLQPPDEISHDISDEINTDSTARIMGPTLPKAGIDVLTNYTDNPPMDLFRSIFASDEELSSSSLSDDDESNDNNTRKDDNSIISKVSRSNSVEQSSDQPALFNVHAIFSHLFEPSGDTRGPLSGLTRMTSRSELSSKVDTSSQNTLNPDLLYGPDLPPDFGSNSEEINPIFQTNDQEKRPHSTLSDDILFVESHLVANQASNKHKKQKSSSKRKHKSKHKKRHKMKKAQKTSISSSSHSDNSSSDTSD